MNILIGIISYFPNNVEVREIRKHKLISLINKCNDLFNLPVLIIAQNWAESDMTDIGSLKNVMLIQFAGQLGITQARRELRLAFLASFRWHNPGFDYLIMLDDDCELLGTKAGADNYIRQIEEHPGMVGLFKDTLLKLFAISKDIFKEFDFDDGEPTQGEIFEDKLFVNKLKVKCPDKIFKFIRHYELDERSDSAWDKNSTWYHGQFDKHKMGERTRELLKNI